MKILYYASMLAGDLDSSDACRDEDIVDPSLDKTGQRAIPASQIQQVFHRISTNASCILLHVTNSIVICKFRKHFTGSSSNGTRYKFIGRAQALLKFFWLLQRAIKRYSRDGQRFRVLQERAANEIQFHELRFYFNNGNKDPRPLLRQSNTDVQREENELFSKRRWSAD